MEARWKFNTRLLRCKLDRSSPIWRKIIKDRRISSGCGLTRVGIYVLSFPARQDRRLSPGGGGGSDDGEVQRVYSTSLTRIVRDPKSPQLGVNYRFGSSARTTPSRSGPNRPSGTWLSTTVFTGVGSRWSIRIAGSPTGWTPTFSTTQGRYVGRGSPLRRIVAKRITTTPGKAARYTLKSVKNGTATPDDIVVFPRVRSELSQTPARPVSLYQPLSADLSRPSGTWYPGGGADSGPVG